MAKLVISVLLMRFSMYLAVKYSKQERLQFLFSLWDSPFWFMPRRKPKSIISVLLMRFGFEVGVCGWRSNDVGFLFSLWDSAHRKVRQLERRGDNISVLLMRFLKEFLNGVVEQARFLFSLWDSIENSSTDCRAIGNYTHFCSPYEILRVVKVSSDGSNLRISVLLMRFCQHPAKMQWSVSKRYFCSPYEILE